MMSLIAASLIAAASLAQSGDLNVQLVDIDGNPRPVPGVVVYLTDADGSPIPQSNDTELSERPSPFLHSFFMISIDQFVSGTTDAAGRVSFDDLAPGPYRVIAQKWDNVDGHPKHPRGFSSADRWRIIPNGVTAFGVGTGTVSADQATKIDVKPVGDSTLAITVKRAHRGNLLSVSLGKPLVMPEMASSILNRHLDREAVLIQHVSQTNGDILLRGLPNDRDVTVALMAYDNNPGAGGIIARAGPGARREIKVHASWSDAEPMPEPAHLKALIDFIEQHAEEIDLFQLLEVGKREDFLLVKGRDYINWMKFYDAASKNAARTITVEGHGQTTAADFMAAWSTVEKRKREAVQKRKAEQLREQKEAQQREVQPETRPEQKQ